MLYVQFDDEEDISEFVKTAGLGLLESDMIDTYKSAKTEGKICVFSFPDTPEVRLVLNRWRNRGQKIPPEGIS